MLSWMSQYYVQDQQVFVPDTKSPQSEKYRIERKITNQPADTTEAKSILIVALHVLLNLGKF